MPSLRSPKSAAVLISGQGSNLQALIEAAAEKDYPARIVRVISNKPEAYGLERARAAGIATEVIPHRDFSTREAFDAELHRALAASGAEIACLAGFMRLLTPGLVARWEGRMLNIHPSLLPAFPGLNTHARAIEAGARFAGCTVHFVTAEMDAGPIILQAAVPVRPEDTPETLGRRVLAAEHRCYPEALRLLAAGRLEIAGNRVTVRGATVPAEPVFNPVPGGLAQIC